VNDTNKVGLYPHPVAICLGKPGKLFVLDYNPADCTSKLLDVRLHVPADIIILSRNLINARSLSFAGDIVYVCHYNSHISVHPYEAVKLRKNLMKADLQEELRMRQQDTSGTIAILKTRLEQYISNVERQHRQNGTNKDHVLFMRDGVPDNILPGCICKASKSMLVVSSDQSRKLYSISLSSDGVLMKGEVTDVGDYPAECRNVISLTVSGNSIFFVAKPGEGIVGGIMKVSLADGIMTAVISNQSAACRECLCVVALPEGEVAFFDVGTHQIKQHQTDNVVTIIAGSGQEGVDDGKCNLASFYQVTDMCAEFGTNLYTVDIQAGTMRLVTSMTGTLLYLENCGKLYSAFNVHLKGRHGDLIQHGLPHAIRKLQEILQYLQGTVREAKVLQELKRLHSPMVHRAPFPTKQCHLLPSFTRSLFTYNRFWL
jgi:hypothetical protein